MTDQLIAASVQIERASGDGAPPGVTISDNSKNDPLNPLKVEKTGPASSATYIDYLANHTSDGEVHNLRQNLVEMVDRYVSHSAIYEGRKVEMDGKISPAEAQSFQDMLHKRAAGEPVGKNDGVVLTNEERAAYAWTAMNFDRAVAPFLSERSTGPNDHMAEKGILENLLQEARKAEGLVQESAGGGPAIAAAVVTATSGTSFKP